MGVTMVVNNEIVESEKIKDHANIYRHHVHVIPHLESPIP